MHRLALKSRCGIPVSHLLVAITPAYVKACLKAFEYLSKAFQRPGRPGLPSGFSVGSPEALQAALRRLCLLKVIKTPSKGLMKPYKACKAL